MEPRCTCADGAPTSSPSLATDQEQQSVTSATTSSDTQHILTSPQTMMPPSLSTNWMDATETLTEVMAQYSDSGGGDNDYTMQSLLYHLAKRADANEVDEATCLRTVLLARPKEQLDELEMAAMVYSGGGAHVKLDTQGRVQFRTTVAIDVNGGSIHAVLTVTIPHMYPEPGHPLDVRVASRKGAKAYLATITNRLQHLADDKSKSTDPSCALVEVLNQALGEMSDMPLAQIAEAYCTCIQCNLRLLKEKFPKIPQPAVLSDNGDCKCLTCGSMALFLPMVKPVADDTVEDVPLCTFCYVEDNPLLFLDCGCVSCFECFVRFADIAICGRQLVKLPYGRGKIALQKFDKQPSVTRLLRELVGIPCPIHFKDPLAVIYHPPLLKLLPAKEYNRYNFFSMEKLFEGQPGVIFCPLPKCCGYLFITDQPGSIVECPFCAEMFCSRCNQLADGASCTCTKYADTQRMSSLMLADRYGSATIYEHRFKTIPVEVQRVGANAKKDTFAALQALTSSSASLSSAASSSTTTTTALLPPLLQTTANGWVPVLITLRARQLPLRLPLDDLWYPILAEFVVRSDLLPYGNQHRSREDAFLTVFHGALLDPAVTLREQLVFSSAVFFVVETFYATDDCLRKVSECAHRLYFAVKSNISDVIARKKCPVCSKPVIHYLNHGCHMILGCHPGLPEWCYVCGAIADKHKCPKGCPLFCKFKVEKDYHGRPKIEHLGCDCVLCPDCKPMRPCNNCTLCPMCTMDGVTAFL